MSNTIRVVILMGSAFFSALGAALNVDAILDPKTAEESGPHWVSIWVVSTIIFVIFAIWHLAAKEIELRHIRDHLPVIKAAPGEPSVESWGYGRSINGHLGA